MKYHKKAQGEQFNWIFIIIGGAIMMAFFTFFIVKYVDLQDQKANIEIARTIDSSFELLETGELYLDDSQFKLGLRTHLESLCFDNEQNILVNGKARKELKNEIVFMPDSSITSSLDAWVQTWKYPFAVSNTLYIANKEKTYYLIYDSQTSAYVKKLNIPEVFNVLMTTENNLEIVNPQESRVVLFTTQKPSLTKIKTKYKNIPTTHINSNLKTITYYEDQEYTLNYLDEQLMLGAIFTNSYENYNCTIQRATTKLENMAKLYTIKAQILNQNNPSSNCFYTEIAKSLNKISNKNYNQKEILLTQNNDLISKGCYPLF